MILYGITGHMSTALCKLLGGGGRCHNLKNSEEASKDTEESPAGCAGEGKQSKGNWEKRKEQVKDN